VKQQNSVGVVKVNLSELKNISKNDITLYNSNLNSKKFKDYSTEKDLLLMNALITEWAKYIGVKVPEPIDMNGLAKFIKESFPNFNDFDLNECITLLANNKLETDAESYGGLSPIYCSKVLHAYQDYKHKILFKVRDEIQKIENNQPKVIDKKQRLTDFKKLLKYASDDVKKGEIFLDTGDVIYEFVKFNKLMNFHEIKDEAIEYGQKKFNEEKKKKVIEATIKFHQYKSVEELNFDKEDKIKKYAREFAINNWLKSINIEEIVSKLTYEMIDIK
jgi:hypothetical protein